MKAMLLKGKNQPLVLETVPDPVPGPGEAVARVLSCGAGLTIHHVRAGRVPVQYPRILGHEITAEIVATGAGVSDHRSTRGGGGGRNIGAGVSGRAFRRAVGVGRRDHQQSGRRVRGLVVG